MNEHFVLLGLAALAVVGMAAQWAAWRLRLPSILLLLVCGIVAGPVTGLLDPDALLGKMLFPVVSLSVALILFEGGLSLDVEELRHAGATVARLVTLGVLLTWALATVAAVLFAGLAWDVALVFGAILTVTGPTVIGPLLRHVRPKGPVGSVAKWEGIVVDPIGATLALLVFEALLVPTLGESTRSAALGLARTILFGGGIGVIGALALGACLRRHWVPDHLESPLTLAAVLGGFALADELQRESGLLAVTAMGFTLANQRSVRLRRIVEFKENLRVLLISTLFLLLSARLELSELTATGLGGLAFVLALVLVVRPASVLLSTLGSRLELRDRLFLAALAPRGIVAAAVSSVFALRLEEAGRPQASLLAPLAFVVIIGTVAVYGLTAGPIARRLGLSDPDAQGALLVGAGRFARALAGALRDEGLGVALVDTNRARVRDARLDGLRVTLGSALEPGLDERMDLGGIGKLLALTPNSEVNTLACLHFDDLFGRAETYRLVGSADAASDLGGRELFADGAAFAALEQRTVRGATVRVTPLTERFGLAAFREHHGEQALLLGRISREGRLAFFCRDDEPAAKAGDRLLSLTDPEPQQAA